jgi:hypothetical protein
MNFARVPQEQSRMPPHRPPPFSLLVAGNQFKLCGRDGLAPLLIGQEAHSDARCVGSKACSKSSHKTRGSYCESYASWCPINQPVVLGFIDGKPSALGQARSDGRKRCKNVSPRFGVGIGADKVMKDPVAKHDVNGSEVIGKVDCIAMDELFLGMVPILGEHSFRGFQNCARGSRVSIKNTVGKQPVTAAKVYEREIPVGEISVDKASQESPSAVGDGLMIEGRELLVRELVCDEQASKSTASIQRVNNAMDMCRGRSSAESTFKSWENHGIAYPWASLRCSSSPVAVHQS